MDYTEAQKKYNDQREYIQSKTILCNAAAIELGEKYIDVQKEMVLRGITTDWQTAQLELMKDQKGRDLLTLWRDANKQYNIKNAEMQLAEFDMRFTLACMTCGMF